MNRASNFPYPSSKSLQSGIKDLQENCFHFRNAYFSIGIYISFSLTKFITDFFTEFQYIIRSIVFNHQIPRFSAAETPQKIQNEVWFARLFEVFDVLLQSPHICEYIFFSTNKLRFHFQMVKVIVMISVNPQ